MEPLTILFPIAVIVLIGAAFAYTRRQDLARTEAMKTFARTRGFAYRARDATLAFRTHLFQQGAARRMSNILQRDDVDVHTLLFDYRYTESHGKTSSTERQTVAAFRRDGRSFPQIELRPENILHRIANAFGWKDIDFENRPEFSSKYLLRGIEETAIRRLMDSNVLAFFEKNLGWNVETENAWVFVYKSDKRVKIEELTSFADAARKIDDVLDQAARRLRPGG